ncbi:MAG: hypothetical protein COZ46_01185 [Verrucomicrobia bacterium CG_4_10_14_3_um_filter_43_23]|nr:MAG: hypothetical protein AUJ82_01220 [Verrucomicrobia bacterium CG1_02_43_26]PIP59518.1 MAG: hypothetical protein COX01_02790 [Verrucomicrobia bacterium CG22_combo_CG10-13_8_21_14_all_43_17]PIX58819.1 MAG: hypothetical protein COZ46_01185 [Verrucomicrobia bacterium CG_4_10_14_3_um_filter_43_23]PIY60915.1 MAG: hypothetical protein COY94_07865 [Verrucomicrobia bacterium CG_4_10_14_0_8_um_filter_43_34]PJA44828.1 MAG: hypothetical protein CO175_00675 [Verrucomicrobia bacterium CG_4_9_14_3_um_fi
MAMDLGLSGLVSGFDWKSFVQQMVSIEGIQKTNLSTEKSGLQNKVDTLSALKTKLESLRTSVDALNSADAFLGRKATIATTTAPVLGSATAASQTLTGTYSLNVTQLATQSTRSGAGDVGAQINGTSDVSGLTLSSMKIATDITAGTFSVNGKQITVATTDSLQSVFDAISTATSGSVTASYNATTDKIELSSGSEILLGTPADTSNFLTSTKLFGNGTGTVSSNAKLGVVKLTNSIANSNLTTSVTSGSMKINGISFTYDTANDSLSSIMTQINASGAGVSITYDAVNDQFKLTNKSTGSYDVSVEDVSGNLLESMGLNSTSTLNIGTNAEYTVNSGGTLTSTSNVLTEDSHGIKGLSVTALKVGTDTLTVEQDSTDTRKKIDDFITKFNEVQTYIDDKTKITTSNSSGKTKVTTSILSNNSEVTALRSGLRKLVFGEVTALTGSIKRIADIGIDFETDSYKLKVADETVLTNALNKNSDEVSKLFTDATGTLSGDTPTGGRSLVLNKFIDSFAGDPDDIAVKGIFETQKTSLNNQITSITKKITDFDIYLKSREEQLTAGFIAMEAAQQKVNQQMAYLSKTFK